MTLLEIEEQRMRLLDAGYAGDRLAIWLTRQDAPRLAADMRHHRIAPVPRADGLPTLFGMPLRISPARSAVGPESIMRDETPNDYIARVGWDVVQSLVVCLPTELDGP